MIMKKIKITLFLFLSVGSLFSQDQPPSIKYGKFNANMIIKKELDSLSKLYLINVITYTTIEKRDTIFKEITYYDQYGITRKKLLGGARKLSVPISLTDHTNRVKFK